MIMCLQGQGQGGRGLCLGQGQADDGGVTWREGGERPDTIITDIGGPGR